MGGGIIQLRSIGKQNKYITGNPDTSYFKAVYHRHTNFAIESIPCVFENPISATSESNNIAVIHRGGDLAHSAHIEFTLKITTSSLSGGTYVNFTNCTGYALIKEISIEFGSQVIDTHISEWFDVWNELKDVNENEYSLVNKQKTKYVYLKSNNEINGTTLVKCYVPLQFWFCRNPGLAIPLIALQNQKVYVRVKFRNSYSLINTDHISGTITPSFEKNPELYVDYIYLDKKERREFAQKKHQYLIEQVQFNGIQTLGTSHDLNFDNSIKELIWMTRNKNAGTEYNVSTLDSSKSSHSYVNTLSSIEKNNDYFNYMSKSNNSCTDYLNASKTYDAFNEAEILFEGNSRFNKRKATYFRTIQPLQYHSRVPLKHIYCYSFSFAPEKYQPSGVCNFSRFKNIKLNFTSPNTVDNTELFIFAISYNLLRIMDGNAGLSYN
tara:strand:- start:411 stop:1721 length:1311 start_codon:yes stop_codon:yes gene_type:complete